MERVVITRRVFGHWRAFDYIKSHQVLCECGWLSPPHARAGVVKHQHANHAREEIAHVRNAQQPTEQPVC